MREFTDTVKQNPRTKQQDITSNGIRGYNIENFTFDKAQGGTLTLGGRNNVSGVLSLRDASGIEKITADNTGITITDGKLTIINSAGSTIIDPAGIVSTANFPSDYVTSAAANTTTSTTAVDLSGSSLAAFTLARSTKVLVLVTVLCRNDSFVVNGSSLSVIVNDSVAGNIFSSDFTNAWKLDSISEDAMAFITGWDITSHDAHSTFGNIFSFTSGSHVLKLQHKVNGSGMSRVNYFQLAYAVLGT